MKFLMRRSLAVILFFFAASSSLALEPEKHPYGERFSNCQNILESKVSRVSRCFDTQLKTLVIIKSVPKEREDKFHSELSMMANWTNKLTRSIKLLEVIYQPKFFAVIEYASGGDLLDLIESAQKNNSSIGNSKIFFRLAMEGLAELHRHGIAHMDIKPENIFLLKNPITGAFKVRMGDFGASEYFSPTSVKLTNTRDGTPGYMAPEVYKIVPAEKSELDFYNPFAADIYSAGITLFGLLTRASFYNEPITTNKEYQLLRTEGLAGWLIAYRMQDQIEPEAIDLIEKMISPDPKERPTIEQVLVHPWLSDKDEVKKS